MPDIISTPLSHAVIATTANILSSHYTHREIDMLFPELGFPGESPKDVGNKTDKILVWLKRLNNTKPEEAVAVLGRSLEDFMDFDPIEYYCVSDRVTREHGRQRMKEVLSKNGLEYTTGGKIIDVARISLPAKTLNQMLKTKDLATIQKEFDRSVEMCDKDPEAAITASCAIIEAFCKIYLEKKNLPLPSDKTLVGLWEPVKKLLRMDPAAYDGDANLRGMIQGFGSVIHSIAKIRTEKGSAHGHGTKHYHVTSRHARLVVGAAHVMTIYLIDLVNETEGELLDLRKGV
jgi:hypothetical protein